MVREELCPCQTSSLINILLACHDKFKVRIEKRTCSTPYWAIGIIFTKKTFLCPLISIHSVLYFPHNYHMVKEETGE